VTVIKVNSSKVVRPKSCGATTVIMMSRPGKQSNNQADLPRSQKSAYTEEQSYCTIHGLTAVIRVHAKSHSDWSKTNITEPEIGGKYHCNAYAHFDVAMHDK
jgi:hypothetical protein